MRGGGRGAGDKGWGGDRRGGEPQGGHYPLAFLFFLAGAGLFLISRDISHWLRVGVACPWKGGKLWHPRENGGNGQGRWFTIVSALGHSPSWPSVGPNTSLSFKKIANFEDFHDSTEI